MIIHDYFRSSAAWRCRIALNLKGIDAERVFVHLRRGEQRGEANLARNPQGMVPSLVTDDGAVLTQSLAIIEWLDETHPEPPLLPRGAVDRALVRGFALTIACDIHPLHNLRVLEALRARGDDEEAVAAWCRSWIEDGLSACEALAVRHGSGRFFHGDAPTIADICLVPQLGAAARFGADTAAMPRLREIASACAALPAFASAEPPRQPDFDL